MNFRFLVKIILVLVVVLLLTTTTVFALDSTISGTIDASSGCMNVSDGAAFPNHIVVFTVSETGSYTISFTSDTYSDMTWFYLFANAYDPTIDNFVQSGYITRSNESGPIVTTLTVGVTYYLSTNNNQTFSDVPTCEARGSTDAGSYTLNVSGPGSITILGSSSASSATDPCPVFHDGRINNCDTANWIVIYGHDYDSGQGLLITDTEGVNLLQVSPAQIAAVPECPDVNTLIASAGDVALYRLAGTCDYQVNGPAADGKTYVVNFDDLYADAGYESHEE